jgi:hypothetical protein
MMLIFIMVRSFSEANKLADRSTSIGNQLSSEKPELIQ